MLNIRKIVTLLIALFYTSSIYANIELPAVFSSGMVLQQRANAPIWGIARSFSTISVQTSWDKKSYQAKADKQGKWKLTIKTPVAGGPYAITLSGDGKLVLSDILIGEVWICSGQSNMEMPVKGMNNQPVKQSSDILLSANNSQIRLFRVEKDISDTVKDNCIGKWQHSSAGFVKDFSAVGFMYAQLLQQQLKVPVGIVQVAIGGTIIEAWMSKSSLFQFAADTANKIGQPAKNQPSVLFNAMLSPWIGYAIKGVIWYQGESNGKNYYNYDKLMAAMVNDWRVRWNQGEFPFYYVQIAPYNYHDWGAAYQKLIPLVQEAQAKAQLLIPNSGMVVTVDAGTDRTIHPPDKGTISKRLALWALGNTYNIDGLPFRSPVYQSSTIEKNTILIRFKDTENGFTSNGQEIAGFEVAGVNKIFFAARAVITSGGIKVLCDKVEAPVAVRYAFKDWVKGNLYNTEGLPVAPFRTDNW